jgi:hypothetical protein
MTQKQANELLILADKSVSGTLQKLPNGPAKVRSPATKSPGIRPKLLIPAPLT